MSSSSHTLKLDANDEPATNRDYVDMQEEHTSAEDLSAVH
jgi:hypothetical protein